MFHTNNPKITHNIGAKIKVKPSISTNWNNAFNKKFKETVKTKGEGVKIGVIDTGCFLHDDIKSNIIKRISLIEEETEDDYNGHGTFICGILCANNPKKIVGIAPFSKIVSVKAVAKSGVTNYEYISQGIYACVIEGCNIINISIGGDKYDIGLHKAVKYAHNNNIPIICASGNDGHLFDINLIDYPARFSETICVGAYQRDKKIANYSTIGEEIDFVAIGNDIYSTYLNNEYATLSGTSFAAPYVTGVLSLYLSENKNTTVDEAKAYLIKIAKDAGTIGKDKKYGYGMIDIQDYISKKPLKERLIGALNSFVLRVKELFNLN